MPYHHCGCGDYYSCPTHRCRSCCRRVMTTWLKHDDVTTILYHYYCEQHVGPGFPAVCEINICSKYSVLHLINSGGKWVEKPRQDDYDRFHDFLKPECLSNADLVRIASYSIGVNFERRNKSWVRRLMALVLDADQDIGYPKEGSQTSSHKNFFNISDIRDPGFKPVESVYSKVWRFLVGNVGENKKAHVRGKTKS